MGKSYKQNSQYRKQGRTSSNEDQSWKKIKHKGKNKPNRPDDFRDADSTPYQR